MLLRRFARALVAPVALALAGCVAGCSGATAGDDVVDDGSAAQTADGWATVGNGVAYRRVGDGDGVFIGYGGYSAKDPWVRGWVSELVRAKLGAMNVGHVYAVRGPVDAGYNGHEIGNRALAEHLARGAGPDAPFVLVAAHSSGAFVAHELLNVLRSGGIQGGAALRQKLVYADLDGGGSGLDRDLVRSLKRVAFVYAVDPGLGASAGRSANAGAIESLASAYGSEPVKLVVRNSGCHAGAKWCLHDLLMTTRPHDPDRYDLARDYTDFAGRPVQAEWVDAVAPDLVGNQAAVEPADDRDVASGAEPEPAPGEPVPAVPATL